jgi:hypothetical protein
MRLARNASSFSDALATEKALAFASRKPNID